MYSRSNRAMKEMMIVAPVVFKMGRIDGMLYPVWYIG